jgi:hypothetical protein
MRTGPRGTDRLDTTATADVGIVSPGTDSISTLSDRCVSSQQVNWWLVHEYVGGRLEQAGTWPMAGTPAWCALPDDDPRKLAALLDAAQHWALRVDTCQQAQCEASRDISAGWDWSAIATEMIQRDCFYRERQWLRRRAAS